MYTSCCRHCDEVTGNVQIHVLGLVQNRHVLLKDFRDGDIVNAYLVFGNQVQQQGQAARQSCLNENP